MPRAPSLLTSAALLQLNRLALRTNLRQRRDGWRRAAGLVLRGPRSSFILSTFGLDLWRELTTPPANPMFAQAAQHFAERLAEYLQSASTPCRRVRHVDAGEDTIEYTDAPCFTLAIEPRRDGPARFIPPMNWSGPVYNASTIAPNTEAPLNFIARVAPDARSVDLWLRVNHVATDGVPAQSLLADLEEELGTVPVTFPAPDEFPAHCAPVPGAPEVSQAQVFIDFAPLLAWRKQENAKLPEPMTIAAALIWKLAHHPAFADLHIGSTVETDHVSDTIGRGVGVVVSRPADYRSRPTPHAGLADYTHDFNHEVTRTRTRASTSMRVLDAAALLSAPRARTILKHGLTNTPTAFGTLALSILKDAKVFGAPLAEYGHAHGFIALGSLALPTRDGRQVGCVTIKGPPNVIAEYPRLITEAICAG